VTDRVLLDVKYTSDEAYRENVGCSIAQPLRFLARLNDREIPTTLRQVIIPTLNDSAENIYALKAIALAHACVDGVELLPFRKICTVKYEQMGIAFPLLHLPEPPKAQLQALLHLLAPEF
jgi:pyruvate formate lyase activating enzyme